MLLRSKNMTGAWLLTGLMLLATGCGIMDPLLPPSKAMIDSAFDSKNTDVRRRAIVKLTRRRGGLKEPTLAAYKHFAGDEDPVIRSIALEALGRGKGRDYLPTIIAALTDKSLLVRKIAAEVLYDMPPRQVPENIYTIATGNDDEHFRARCLRILAHYDSDQTRRTLLIGLEDESFDVRLAARKTLIELTGKDMRYDRRAWRKILSDTPVPQEQAGAPE